MDQLCPKSELRHDCSFFWFVCFRRRRLLIQEVLLHSCIEDLRDRGIRKDTIRTNDKDRIQHNHRNQSETCLSRKCWNCKLHTTWGISSRWTIQYPFTQNFRVVIHCRELFQYLQNILSCNLLTADTSKPDPQHLLARQPLITTEGL